MQTDSLNCLNLVSFRGPPEPPTRGFGPGPHWEHISPRLILSSRSALAMISPPSLTWPGAWHLSLIFQCPFFLKVAICSDGKSFLCPWHLSWISGKKRICVEFYYKTQPFIIQISSVSGGEAPWPPTRGLPGHSPQTPIKSSRSALAMISPPSLTV